MYQRYIFELFSQGKFTRIFWNGSSYFNKLEVKKYKKQRDKERALMLAELSNLVSEVHFES